MAAEYAIIVTKPYCVELIGMDDYHLTLEQLWNFCDCDCIQIVKASDGHLMVCDDCGKIKRLPVNPIATKLYAPDYDFMVGNVVIGTSFSPDPNDEPDIFAMPWNEAMALYMSLE